MSRTITVITAILLVCLTLAALGGLVWANTLAVHTQPVEKDFLVPWLGARTFLQYGDSPYSDPATQRAQILYYGRLAEPGQDPLALWLPFPLELLYFPIALINDYSLARAIWVTCLEIALVVMAFLTLRLTGWKPRRMFLPVVLLFPLLWVYGVFSLVSASAAGFVALALAGFLLALRAENDELAGILLVLLVSAVRLTGVLAFFIFWWIIYQRRWRVLWGFLMAIAVLLALAFLFLPDWFLPFLNGLLLHYAYNPGFTSIGIFAAWSPVVGLRIGWILAAGLLLALFFEWGSSMAKDHRSFLWVACLTLSVTPLLGIPFVPRDYPFLLIPLMLFLAILSERWPRLKRWDAAGMVMLVILVGLWLLTLTLNTALTGVLILLLPALLVLGLYWMRWRFIHPMPAGLRPPP
ncbi:MAG: hypothetical protein WCE68_09720 [Anaerolineales bacterium]